MITIFNLRVVQKRTEKQKASRQESRALGQHSITDIKAAAAPCPCQLRKSRIETYRASGVGQAREGSQPSVPFENARVEARGSCTRMQTADTSSFRGMRNSSAAEKCRGLQPCECLHIHRHLLEGFRFDFATGLSLQRWTACSSGHPTAGSSQATATRAPSRLVRVPVVLVDSSTRLYPSFRGGTGC